MGDVMEISTQHAPQELQFMWSLQRTTYTTGVACLGNAWLNSHLDGSCEASDALPRSAS
jgi:hypothetical protein